MAISNQPSPVDSLPPPGGDLNTISNPPPMVNLPNPNQPPAQPPPSMNSSGGQPPGITDVTTNLPLSSVLISNPPSAPRLVHGYMKSQPGTTGPAGPFYLYFLFNPAEIDNQYNFSNSVLPQAQQQNPTLLGSAAIMQNQLFSFQIEFDRTYEVETFMAGSQAQAGDEQVQSQPGKDGVMYDVRALERLIGMYDANAPPAGFTSVPGPNIGDSANSPQMVPIDVFFGGGGSFRGFVFRGWVTSLEIELSRFSHTMVPVHCTCSISMARIWLDPNELDINLPPPGGDMQNPKGEVVPNDTSLFPMVTTI